MHSSAAGGHGRCLSSSSVNRRVQGVEKSGLSVVLCWSAVMECNIFGFVFHRAISSDGKTLEAAL
jgi:hypothetical protein